MRNHWKNIPILITIILLPFVMLGVYFALDTAISKTIEDEAEHKATRWATYFEKKLPQIEKLTQAGVPTNEQIELIQSVVSIGDVFRFKLFRPDGQIVIVSDETTTSTGATQSDAHSLKAKSVFDTGQSIVTMKDGSSKTNRPDIYVEAYVLAKTSDGRKIGVVEVYVNQTYSAKLARSTFSMIGYGIPILCGLIYLFTSSAFLWRDSRIRKAEEKVREMSLTDELTGLYNRRALNEKLNGKLKCAGTTRTGIIFFDIDNFKSINDENGHDGGDRFLKHVSKKITDVAGESNLVARMGGDEFVVAVDCKSESDLGIIAERMLASVREPLGYKGTTIFGNMSAGCFFPNEETSLDEAMNLADLALYTAKSTGKDAAIIYTAAHRAEAIAAREIETCVLNGLKNENYSIEFQPITDAASRKTIGFEALLRLEGENGLRIAPDSFIPVAERLGFIGELGSWVLREAVTIASSWPDTYFLSVNLSPKQFDDGRLVETIERILLATKFPANRLELEITESLFLNDSEHVVEQIEQLKQAGISIAMDDFGTGYSSLAHLWKFGFDTLKIDQSFLTHKDNCSMKLQDVLQNIIDLGHKMGMKVTAEGVETNELATMLAELKCDHLQGYLFGKPMPVSQLARFFANEMVETTITPLRMPNDSASKKVA